jgi:uncharacterized iron-regulated membrane protein
MVMAARNAMRTLARWHIWLGWLIGVPLILWTASGLFMVARPIEEVRGNHLRRPAPEPAAMPHDVSLAAPFLETGRPGITEVTYRVERGRPVAIATLADKSIARFDAVSGEALPLPDEATVRQVVARGIVGGEAIVSARLRPAENPPADWRRDEDVWQVALKDGTHVYVDPGTTEIKAVRTRWWRAFDFMWGLHIMDLQTREDTSHPILIAFAALSLIGVSMGTVLLFRRRRRRKSA